jgi:hypothetical protein
MNYELVHSSEAESVLECLEVACDRQPLRFVAIAQ